MTPPPPLPEVLCARCGAPLIVGRATDGLTAEACGCVVGDLDGATRRAGEAHDALQAAERAHGEAADEVIGLRTDLADMRQTLDATEAQLQRATIDMREAERRADAASVDVAQLRGDVVAAHNLAHAALGMVSAAVNLNHEALKLTPVRPQRG